MLLQVLIWIAVAIACIVVGKYLGTWLFGAKKEVSGIKRAAQSLSISLREAGLKRIPAMLDEFVVGDADDLFNGLKDLALVLKAGNESIVKELDATFDRCLNAKLSTPEGRALVEAKLNDAKKVAFEIAKAAAPVVATAVIAAL